MSSAPGPDMSELVALEEALWRPATRFDRQWLAGVLDEAFVEFGRSGRIWTREQVLATRGEPMFARLPLPRLKVTELAEGLVQMSYVSVTEGDGEPRIAALRSSLWRWAGDRWRLVFSQGTPCSPDLSEEEGFA